jgi:hypothetical protein
MRAVRVSSARPSLSCRVVDDDHGAVARVELLDVGAERSARALRELAEVGEHRVAAAMVAGDRVRPGLVEDGVLADELEERVDVAGVEGLVTAADEIGVALHDVPPGLGLPRPSLEPRRRGRIGRTPYCMRPLSTASSAAAARLDTAALA